MSSFRTLLAASLIGASAMAMAAAPASAAPCRDAHGKFAKCPAAVEAAITNKRAASPALPLKAKAAGAETAMATAPTVTKAASHNNRHLTAPALASPPGAHIAAGPSAHPTG